jgi:hypothetical protein
MKDLPKTIRGWTLNSNTACVNSILSLYNPFETIQSPYMYIQYSDDESDKPSYLKEPLYRKWQYENGAGIWYSIDNPFEFFLMFSKRKYNHLKNK